MSRTTDYLMNTRRIAKLHETMLKTICEQYHLTLIEAKIISFLHNNPGLDTAGDIVELRTLSKGNVSQSVESLIQKSLLQRNQDTEDRRKIHLTLLPAAKPVTDALDANWEQFHEELFQGFSVEERTQLNELNRRLMDNARDALKRREPK